MAEGAVLSEPVSEFKRPKSLVSERLARAGFEIPFKFPSRPFRRYGDIGLQINRQMGFCRIQLARLM
jgi:hypothetical protein